MPIAYALLRWRSDKLTTEKRTASTHTNNQANQHGSLTTTITSSSQDSLTIDSNSESVSHKLRQYALENPGKALSISILSFGGILLLIYFFRIGFLPDINLESATTLLYAVSILGLFILVMLAIYLVMPAMASKALWHDYRQQGGLTKTWAIALSSIAACLGCLIGWMLQDIDNPLGLIYGILIAVALAFFIAICLAFFIEGSYVPDLIGPPTKYNRHVIKSRKFTAALLVVFTSFVQWLLLLFVLLLVWGLGNDGVLQNESPQAYLVFIFPLILSAAIPYIVHRMAWNKAMRLMCMVGPVMLFVLLMITESISKPSAIVIAHLGAGEYEATRLVLSGKGCKQLNLALGGLHCAEVKDDEPTALCPVSLRSRIGAQILIEVAPMTLRDKKQTEKQKTEKKPIEKELVWLNYSSTGENSLPRQRVVLDKSMLLAWSTLAPIGVVTEKPTSPPQTSTPASSVYMKSSAPARPNSVEQALLKLCGEKQPVSLTPSPPAPKPRPPKPLPQPPKPVACCCTAAPVSAASRICQDAAPLSPKVSVEPAHVES